MRRIFAVSFGLAGLETALLLGIGYGMLYRCLTHFIFVPAAVYASFGRGRYKAFLENWGVSYLAMLLLGGIREMMWEQSFFSRGGVVEYAASVGLFLGILCYLSGRRTYGANECEVCLKHGGRELWLKAYVDSGNQLRDVYTKKAVHIIEIAQAKKLFDGREMPVRYLPYRALGKTDGMIKVVTIEEMEVSAGERKRIVTGAVLGLAEGDELEGQPFDVILHGGVWQE